VGALQVGVQPHSQQTTIHEYGAPASGAVDKLDAQGLGKVEICPVRITAALASLRWQAARRAASRERLQTNSDISVLCRGPGLTPRPTGNERVITGGPLLGPRWVRAATVPHGHQRSPTVVKGSEESQVAGRPAQVAGMMQAGDSDCGPEGRGDADCCHAQG
jgi:hypothetical protein